VPLLGALAALALMLAIVLLAAGSLVAGLILLALAIASFTLFGGGVRREPDAPAGRLVLRTAYRARALAGLIAVAVRAWARAALDLIRIRGRQQRLRRNLKANLAPLGEAVHQDDQQRAQELKQKAAEIDQQLSEAERDASAVIAEARQQIERERSTIEPTQALARPQAEQAVDPPPDGASNGHIGQGRQQPNPPPATHNRRPPAT
jgi:hypothetical protein